MSPERLGAPPPQRPMSPELAEIVPPFEEGRDENTDVNAAENQEMAARSAAAERMRSRFRESQERQATEPAQAPGEQATGAQPEGDQDGEEGDGVTALDIAKDVGLGVLETPRALLTGAIGAVNEIPAALADITEALPKLSGGVQFGTDPKTGEFRFGFASKEELEAIPSAFRAIPGVPTPEGPESVTGKGVEAITKFATGFVGTGKLKPIQALRGLGKAGAITATAARGALTDFTVFDPHEGRLADIVQEFPALQNPVSEFLASEPGDSGVEGRLKNAVEGVGLGVAFDGLVGGLRILREARKGKKGAETAVSLIDELETTVGIQRKRFADELVGVKEDAPLVSIRQTKAPAAEGGAESATLAVNWGRIESPEDVTQIVQKIVKENAAGADPARTGRKRGIQASNLSPEGQNSWDTLQQRRIGEPMGDAETAAVRELWVESGGKVVALAEQVRAAPRDTMTALAFRKQLAIHNSVQEMVAGSRVETQRALASWRIPKGDTLDFTGQMDEMTSQLRGDAVRTFAIAEGVSNMSRGGRLLAETDTFVYGSPLQKTSGMIRQFWYASLLSSPHTHMRNLISQTAVMGTQMLERKVANLIGRALGDVNVAPGETMAMAHGMVMGVRDAFRIGAKGRSGFREAWATGQSGIGIGKVDVEQVGAFNPERLGVSRESTPGKALSFIDSGTRAPMRALAASDEVFKSAGSRMEMHALAHRQAWSEVQAGRLDPKEMSDRIARIMQDPSESIKLEARRSAEAVTFTQEPGEGARVFNAMRSIQKIPVVGRIAMPFTRTNYNLANHAFQRTPLAVVSKSFRDDLAAGGARADLAYARLLTGSGLMMVIGDMSLKGLVTGEGPQNFAERQTLKRTQNWQPMSIQIGGEWFSYRGLEPVATAIGLTAKIVELLQTDDWDDENKEMTDVALVAAMSIANEMTSETYMSGVSSFLEASSSPERFGKSFFNRLAGSVVPTGFSQLNRSLLDPMAREAVSAMDAVQARTFGLSKTLPSKRDLWGKEITYASQWGKAYDLIVPIYGTTGEDPEPIDTELLRLGAPMGRPKKLVTFEGVDVNLAMMPESYSRYLQLAGNELTESTLGIPVDPMTGMGLKDTLNALVTGNHPRSQIYKLDMQTDGQDGSRARMIRSMVQAYRDAAKDQILLEFPEIAERVVQGREDSGTQITGVR